jgi:hypothetical protein
MTPRWSVAATSMETGELAWVTPSGRIVSDAWRAARFGNQAKAVELAGRLPKWQAAEVVPAPAQETPSAPAAAEPAAPTSRASDWQGTAEKGVQVRRRADGTVVYRARRDGKASPTFETLQEAREWRQS